jgi:hypothetical protein
VADELGEAEVVLIYMSEGMQLSSGFCLVSRLIVVQLMFVTFMRVDYYKS